MEHAACPLCSGEGSFALKRKDGLPVFHCGTCDLRFILKSSFEDLYGSLQAVYEKDYYDSTGDCGYRGYADVPIENFLWQRAFIELFGPARDKKILDIGCGTGKLLGLLQSKGARTEGIEVSSYAAAIAQSQGLKASCGDITAVPADASFDIITAFDVIEHVPDLQGFMERIRTLLSDNGLFLFLTPDAGSLRAVQEQERWYGYNSSLEHLCYFSVQSLGFLLRKVFGHDPVLYQAATTEGDGILGFMRKTAPEQDRDLQELFGTGFSLSAISDRNVIQASILLKRMGDSRHQDYVRKFSGYIISHADREERAYLDLSGTDIKPGDRSRTVFRSFEEGDQAGIVKLFRETFGKTTTEAEWEWKYRGQGNTKVCSAVMQNDKAGIVGHYGGVPVRMIHNRREVKGIAIVDVMIRSDFRGFLSLKRLHNHFIDMLVKDSVVFFYGFPTENTLMLPAEKLGLYDRFEPVYEAIKTVQMNNTAGRFLYELFPLDFADSRIDSLWEEIRPSLSLAVIRDREYLDWRYRKSPLFTYELWGMKKRFSNAPLALAVLKRSGEKLQVMDMVCRDHDLAALFLKVENLAYATGIKTLSLWMAGQFHALLKKAGFDLVPSGTTIPRSPHPLTLKREEVVGKLFYTMGDTDFI